MGWQDDWDADQRTEQAYREWAAREAAKGNTAKEEHWNKVADGIARRGEQRRNEGAQSGGGRGCGLTLLPPVAAVPMILLYRWWKQR